MLAACGGSGGEQQAPPPRTLTVSAAASLTSVYNQLKPQFEQANPGVTVQFNFGGSDTLAQQVVQGAPADVLATASTKTMQTAQQAGRIQGEPITYATNKLQIAVQPGNPKQVIDLSSLVGPQVTESVCAPAVPCGAATEAAERAAGVTLDPVVRGAGRALGAPARHHPQRRRGPRLRQRRDGPRTGRCRGSTSRRPPPRARRRTT